MFKQTHKLMLGASLSALPVLFLIGCGGGSGGGVLGSPTATPGPTATPLPPGEGYTINLTFSNVQADFVKSKFNATGGDGSYRVSPTSAFTEAYFDESGVNTRQVRYRLSKASEFQVGDTFQLATDPQPGGLIHTLQYVDFTHGNQTFNATSGSFKITEIVRTVNASGGFFTLLKFQITNAKMEQVKVTGNETGSFTANGSGFTISTKESLEQAR